LIGLKSFTWYFESFWLILIIFHNFPLDFIMSQINDMKSNSGLNLQETESNFRIKFNSLHLLLGRTLLRIIFRWRWLDRRKKDKKKKKRGVGGSSHLSMCAIFKLFSESADWKIISASSCKWHKYLELDSSHILIIQILRTKAVNLILQESNSWGNKNLKGRWIQLSKKIKTSWRFVTKAQPALSKSTAYFYF
jgi:hypothetical protein